jgi:hypothetical protein
MTMKLRFWKRRAIEEVVVCERCGEACDGKCRASTTLEEAKDRVRRELKRVG